jgi:hypothetical protein
MRVWHKAPYGTRFDHIVRQYNKGVAGPRLPAASFWLMAFKNNVGKK